MKSLLTIISWYLLITFIGLKSVSSQQTETKNFSEINQYIPGYGLKKMKHPEMFQGNREKDSYFEGWYFKMVSGDNASILSVIPGISLSEDGREKHAFIQLINGTTTETFYYSYPIESFSFSEDKFAVWIGNNFFSKDSMLLDIQNDSIRILGKVSMSDQIGLSANKNRTKRIMGWYYFVPFMECYHGVVSLTHVLQGSINMNNTTYNFDNGKGYLEKDWGESMPSSWIWIQTNHFNDESASFMLSIANIPWLGNYFTGFLGFFLYDGQVQQFGTYTGAEVRFEMNDLNNLDIFIDDKKYHYQVKTYQSKSGFLKAPMNGNMDRRIAEGIDAKLKLIVSDKEGIEIFSDSSTVAGLEMVGNLEILVTNAKKTKQNDDE